MRLVRLVALLLALAALPAPWFQAAGRSIPVYEIPVLFTITYFAGLAASILSLVSRESMAPLAAALLFSTSPVYAYFALRIVAQHVFVDVGSALCVASAVLHALEWIRGSKGGGSELLSEEEPDERNGTEAVDWYPEA